MKNNCSLTTWENFPKLLSALMKNRKDIITSNFYTTYKVIEQIYLKTVKQSKFYEYHL